MQTVAILNKEASVHKSSFDAIHMRAEILNTPELERDWENIYRRYANPEHTDMQQIHVMAEGFDVVKIYNVSDRVLDAMYNLGREDNKVSKSALNWAIDQIANGEGEFLWDKSDKRGVVFWVQSIALAMVRKINPNFIGYVSHVDEDEVVNKICDTIEFADKQGIKRPSCQQIVKYWLEGDWAPIYMYTKD